MSSAFAIRIENLGKKYTLPKRARTDGLRHAIQEAVSLPYRALRNRLRGGTNADGGYEKGEPESEMARDEEFWALKDVSFEIKRGDVVGIIGRNGAGKSTLLKILSRITEPTRGRVEIDGRVASLLEVGTGFHPELTGRENIFLNGAILGMSRAEVRSKFDEIVSFAEIEKFLDTPVKRYSSGMYVRLAFAVAAHLEPEILVVDEVLAVGDHDFQRKCLGKMQDVSTRDGRTVLFVSHNVGAVRALCKTGVLLDKGALVTQGLTEDVLARYFMSGEIRADGFYDLLTSKPGPEEDAPRIASVRIRNHIGTESSTVFTNENMSVELAVQNWRRSAPPRVAIALEDSYGRRIGTSASYFGRVDPPCEPHFTATCVLPSLPLGPGRYFLSVSIADKAEGLLDAHNSVIQFDVEAGNCYGNGERFHPVYGPVLLTGEWGFHNRFATASQGGHSS